MIPVFSRSTSFAWGMGVETTGQALGQPLPINYVPVGAAVPLIPEMMSLMMTGFETSESAIDMRETSKIYGIPPTPLADFAKRFFGALA